MRRDVLGYVLECSCQLGSSRGLCHEDGIGKEGWKRTD
jgi:hypothetical protein